MSVRVALVGCGTVARVTHLPGLRAGGDAEVVVFASRTLSSAQRARDAWGSGDVTSDWQGALARDDVDAVDVCLPNALHAQVVRAALRVGKHVLVEKPMTTTLQDADELLALRGDRVLAVAFDARCDPALIELRRLLPSIGRPVHVDAVLGHGGPQLWAPDAIWFRDPELSGGGCLLDLGSHLLDALAWCVGPVREVVSAKISGSPVDEEAELELVCAAATTARLTVSWRLPSPELSITVRGERGELAIRNGQLLHDGTRLSIPERQIPGAAAAFARAVATGTAPPADGADGRAALASVLAGYACATSGRPRPVA